MVPIFRNIPTFSTLVQMHKTKFPICRVIKIFIQFLHIKHYIRIDLLHFYNSMQLVLRVNVIVNHLFIRQTILDAPVI